MPGFCGVGATLPIAAASEMEGHDISPSDGALAAATALVSWWAWPASIASGPPPPAWLPVPPPKPGSSNAGDADPEGAPPWVNWQRAPKWQMPVCANMLHTMRLDVWGDVETLRLAG